MSRFYTFVKEAVSYALADKYAFLAIGTIAFVLSIADKLVNFSPAVKVLKVLIFFIVGYGSYISWYTLKGSDRHPDLRNYKRLFWEGFKKCTITMIYSIVLTYIIHLAKQNIADGNMLFGAIFAILFAAVYLILIGGLLNRYLHRGKILKAFDIPQIVKLISIFDVRSFIMVLVAVIIAQASAVLVLAGFSDEFSLLELIYSVFAFFLMPFVFLSTKRLVGLTVYVLLDNMKDDSFAR